MDSPTQPQPRIDASIGKTVIERVIIKAPSPSSSPVPPAVPVATDRHLIWAGLVCLVAVLIFAGALIWIQQHRRAVPPIPPITPGELRITLNRSSFRESNRELLTADISLPQEGYLYVLGVDATGAVTTLYPDTKLQGGETRVSAAALHLPDDLPRSSQGDARGWLPMIPAQLKGAPVVGESIIAVLSDQPRRDLILPEPLIMKDSTLRQRGIHPVFVQTTARRLDFSGTLHTIAHYEVRP